MQIVIVAETYAGETRVAATPETVKKLVALGHRVRIASGAGHAASFLDEAYSSAGAEVCLESSNLLLGADLVLAVRAPTPALVAQIPEKAAIIALFDPYRYAHYDLLAARQISAFALELIPRISRAQSMDVLSSQANIAGYRAVLLAAQYYPRFMPMLMTAAGTVKPARVLVLGAGVAGLQAVATAKRLGAILEVFDVRPAVKEQVESLGAKFIEVEMTGQEKQDSVGVYAKEMSEDYKRRQAELIAERAKEADIIITTALIPGKAAPVLITEDTVACMKPGAVIVDLAVEQGGNCPLSKPGEIIVTPQKVTLVGLLNLPALLGFDASVLYARNILSFLDLIISKEGKFSPILEDEIVSASLITHAGVVRFEHPIK